MVVELAVGDGDSGGALDGIDEAIGGSGHRDMVDPYVVGAEDGDAVAIAVSAEADVVDSVPDESTVGWNNVVDPYVMDYDVVDELEGEACTIGNVDLGSPAINGLVAGED